MKSKLLSEEHRSGWVALIGPTNAGKSTLMNGLVGEKVSIVSDRPQTTRNRITGILSEPAFQAVFMDTPGVYDRPGKLNRQMQLSAWESLAGADAALVVLDVGLYVNKPQALDHDLEELAEPVRSTGLPILVVVNKIDLFKDKSRMLPVMERISEVWPEASVVPVSALRREGLEELLRLIVDLLPEGPPIFPEDQISTAPLRFMAAEVIREKLFQRLRQELPYSISVDIEQWEEVPEANRTNISAVIYVARKNHKAMVIGKQGSLLKEVGSEARKEIQGLLDHKVFLELWVKVKENWTEDESFLRQMGIGQEAEASFFVPPMND